MAAALLLLEALDKLSTKDMGRFHFHLKLKMVDGCNPITTQRLEGQSREGTVAVMIDQYGDDLAVKVTDVILEKMALNNIRRELTRAYEGAAN